MKIKIDLFPSPREINKNPLPLDYDPVLLRNEIRILDIKKKIHDGFRFQIINDFIKQKLY